MTTTRREYFRTLVQDAVEVSREALGYGLPMSQLGNDAKVAVSRLAAALIQHQTVEVEERINR